MKLSSTLGSFTTLHSHYGMKVAPGMKIAQHLEIAGFQEVVEILIDAIGSLLMGDISAAVLVQIELKGLKFYHPSIGDIRNMNGGEIRIT